MGWNTLRWSSVKRHLMQPIQHHHQCSSQLMPPRRQPQRCLVQKQGLSMREVGVMEGRGSHCRRTWPLLLASLYCVALPVETATTVYAAYALAGTSTLLFITRNANACGARVTELAPGGGMLVCVCVCVCVVCVCVCVCVCVWVCEWVRLWSKELAFLLKSPKNYEMLLKQLSGKTVCIPKQAYRLTMPTVRFA